MLKRLMFSFLATSFLAASAYAQKADCAHATLLHWASEHGFTAQSSGGNDLYCRSINVVGSRIPHTECGTEAELAAYALNQIVNDNIAQWTCGEIRP